MDNATFKAALDHCVRCGTCKANCPSYGAAADETASARGRVAILHAIITGDLAPSAGAVDMIFSCLQCGACGKDCPAGINVPEVIYRGRELLTERRSGDRLLRLIASFGGRHTGAARRISPLLFAVLGGYLRRKGLVPPDFSSPPRSLGARPSSGKLKKRGTIAVFRGCATVHLYPRLHTSLVNVLGYLGYEAVPVQGEVCCGAPFRGLGMVRDAEELARKNLRAVSHIGADTVVSLCPTCVHVLRNEYPGLIGSGIVNAVDIDSFLAAAGLPVDMEVPGHRAVYHDPCHLRYGLGVRKEPRAVLSRCGVTLVEGFPAGCCGFGGVHSIQFRERALAIAHGRGREVEAAGVQTVYTSCPGCVFHLRKTMRCATVAHTIEAVERALSGGILVY